MRPCIFLTFSIVFLVFGVIYNSAAEDERDDTADFWRNAAKRQLYNNLNKKRNNNIAKNVIIFVGDGMGIPTIAAARILKGQKNLKRGEETLLSFEKFPNVALIKTYNVDKQVPDSAGTATAIFSGVKAKYETLGVSPSAIPKDCNSSLGQEITSILQWAQEEGKDTGIVTTTRLTHATPAALYSHSASRYWESDVSTPENASFCKDIARQMIEDIPGKNVKLFLGGGRRQFLTNNTGGERKDERNLIDDWIKQKTSQSSTSAYVQNARELRSIDIRKTDYLLGIFATSHLQYEVERDKTPDGQPSIAEMTQTAIRFLQKNNKGFFLMVEGGRIDHAHHDNLAGKALEDTIALDEAVEATLQLVDTKDTLVLVTADHSHVMTINGYPDRGNPILGIAGDSDMDHLPYTTLMYTTGANAVNHTHELRQKLNDIIARDSSYQQISMVPFTDETHGGEDVAVYAVGPMSHLFQGVQEQNYITHVMGYASCVGDIKTHCNNSEQLKVSLHLVAILIAAQLFKIMFKAF